MSDCDGRSPVLCWFLDAGNIERSAGSTDRRPKSAKAAIPECVLWRPLLRAKQRACLHREPSGSALPTLEDVGAYWFAIATTY